MVETESSDDDGEPPVLKTYTEQFWEAFPSYLAMGMTEEQYWDGDAKLVESFRKADEIRREKRNTELWLQGLYIYEALCDVSPVLQAFAKKGTKPREYISKPYPITERALKKSKADKSKAAVHKGKAYMEAMMVSLGKKFGKQEGG